MKLVMQCRGVSRLNVERKKLLRLDFTRQNNLSTNSTVKDIHETS